jgi:hypothetical protein
MFVHEAEAVCEEILTLPATTPELARLQEKAAHALETHVKELEQGKVHRQYVHLAVKAFLSKREKQRAYKALPWWKKLFTDAY